MQKRAYKLLTYILEERQDFALAHFQDILDSLLLGVASSMSAAKRYRLRCLQVFQIMPPNSPLPKFPSLFLLSVLLEKCFIYAACTLQE